MSYDQAMRLYGIDKPDMRLPAMVDVREALTAEELEEFAAKFRVRKELPIASHSDSEGGRNFGNGTQDDWNLWRVSACPRPDISCN